MGESVSRLAGAAADSGGDDPDRGEVGGLGVPGMLGVADRDRLARLLRAPSAIGRSGTMIPAASRIAACTAGESGGAPDPGSVPVVERDEAAALLVRGGLEADLGVLDELASSERRPDIV